MLVSPLVRPALVSTMFEQVYLSLSLFEINDRASAFVLDRTTPFGDSLLGSNLR